MANHRPIHVTWYPNNQSKLKITLGCCIKTAWRLLCLIPGIIARPPIRYLLLLNISEHWSCIYVWLQIWNGRWHTLAEKQTSRNYWPCGKKPVKTLRWGLMRPVSGLNIPFWRSQLPAGESPADTLAPAISRGCPSCLHWLLTWVACGAHPCRSCMIAPRDYFQDDKEASGILKIIKS